MAKLPEIVKLTFEKLRDNSTSRLSLKLIGNRYYVYKEHGVWLKDKKRNKTISEYFGRIDDDGIFIQKRAKYSNDLERAEALIKERGGRILWDNNEEKQDFQPMITADEIDKKLLMILSMNAKASYSFMSKHVGLTVPATYSRVKNLEKKYGIRYTLEIDREKLGYTRFIGFVKFNNKKPTLEELRKAMVENPKVQFAALTSGEYDIVFYLVDKTSDEAIDDVWIMKSNSLLKNYDSDWFITPMSNNYGYVPIRKEFFNVIQEYIWKRTKYTPRPAENQLTTREFIILSELNENSSMKFKEIDEKYNFPKGTTNYTYTKLKKKGIIKRATINMENLPMKYLSIISLKNINAFEFNKTRTKTLMEIMEYGKIANRYSLVGDMGAPYSFIFFYPVMIGEDLTDVEKHLGDKIMGVSFKSIIISTVLVGALCFRRFDNNYSRQYGILVNQKTIKPKEQEIYDVDSYNPDSLLKFEEL